MNCKKIIICIIVCSLLFVAVAPCCDAGANNNQSSYGQYVKLGSNDSCSYDGSNHYYNSQKITRMLSDGEHYLYSSNVIVTSSNQIFYSNNSGDGSYSSIYASRWSYSVNDELTVLYAVASNGLVVSIEYPFALWAFSAANVGDYTYYRTTPSLTLYVNSMMDVYTNTLDRGKMVSSLGLDVFYDNIIIGEVSCNYQTVSKDKIAFTMNSFSISHSGYQLFPRVFIIPIHVYDGAEYANQNDFGPFSQLKIGDSYTWDGTDYYYNENKLIRSIVPANISEENVIKTDNCVVTSNSIIYYDTNGFKVVKNPQMWQLILLDDGTMQLYYEVDGFTQLVEWRVWQWGFCATDHGDWAQVIYNKTSRIYFNDYSQIYTCSPDSAGWLTSNGMISYRNGVPLTNSITGSVRCETDTVYSMLVDLSKDSYAIDYGEGIFHPRVYMVPQYVQSYNADSQNTASSDNSQNVHYVPLIVSNTIGIIGIIGVVFFLKKNKL